MRIGILSSWPSVHTEYWLSALRRRGHHIHFISPYARESDLKGLPEGVISHPLLKKPGRRPTGPVLRGLELRHLLREIRPEVLHVHSIFAIEKWRHLPWVAAMCAFHPLVLTAWGSDLFQVPKVSRAGRWLLPFVLRRADLITADSQSLLDAAERVGVTKNRLYEIQFGVDTMLFHPITETESIRKHLDIGPGPVVFSPRAFMPLYNQVNIVEAIPKVLQRHPHCRFVFKCRSEYHSPDYESRVRRRIEELGLTQTVRIVPPIPYREMPGLYALSDVVVSVPTSDGTPRSVLEAMASGAFPVVSDVPSLHEWIHHGENGLFVRSSDPDDIAEAIVRALASQDILLKARVENRRIVETKASHEFWVSQLEMLYKKVTTGSNPLSHKS